MISKQRAKIKDSGMKEPSNNQNKKLPRKEYETRYSAIPKECLPTSIYAGDPISSNYAAQINEYVELLVSTNRCELPLLSS